MISITDIQTKLNEVKQELIDLSKQAGDAVKSVAEPDGAIHQKVQADLDALQNTITTTFNSVTENVKTTVHGWFKS